MTVSKENYLTGKCLVSMPNMQDERFADTLIYICSHSKDGAMGFVVNKKIKEFSFADLANQRPINTLRPIEAIDLHQGGPLEKVRGFVLHSTDYVKEDTIAVSYTHLRARNWCFAPKTKKNGKKPLTLWELTLTVFVPVKDTPDQQAVNHIS